MKRILTIQDISGVGKCSLTVALPLLSAVGIETAVLPTAVLSTHTAFQKGFTLCDLTKEIEPIVTHWKREGITFDAIYSGYLASEEQIELVKWIFSLYPDALAFVDPVMADNGKLYAGFDDSFPEKMASLCSVADVVLPNITEAAFLTGLPYPASGEEELTFREDSMHALLRLAAKTVVLTGVSDRKDGKDLLGVASLSASTGERTLCYENRVPASFHGTGDVFASVVLGALMRDFPLSRALEIAAKYTAETIRVTLEDPDHRWYGVNFEETIPYLLPLFGMI